jgi:glucose-6-phosphate 1-dehydrogenase
MFPVGTSAPDGRRNEITIDVADPGSIAIGFLAKEPGAAMKLGPAELSFRYEDAFCADHGLEGYERLLLDAMVGDQSLFTRSDAVERLWKFPPPAGQPAPGSALRSPAPGARNRYSTGSPRRTAGACQTSELGPGTDPCPFGGVISGVRGG